MLAIAVIPTALKIRILRFSEYVAGMDDNEYVFKIWTEEHLWKLNDKSNINKHQRDTLNSLANNKANECSF